MQYIVTFEEQLLVNKETRWVESSRIFTRREEVRNFLEFMYDSSPDTFRNAHVWTADELSHDVRSTVWFES